MPANKQSLQVLLVEDNPQDASLILSELARSGYLANAERVATEDQFRKHCSRQTWDLVLVDDAVPGHVSLLQLDCLHGREHPPVIVIAASSDADSAARAVRNGADDVVPKSHLAHLGPAVAMLLQGSEARYARKKAEAALRETEERFHTLTDNSFDLVCEVDAQGCCTYASPNYHQVLGHAPSDLVSQTIFDQVHPDDRAQVVAEFTASLSGLRVGQAEYRHLQKNGAWAWLESAMRAIRVGEDARSVVIISRDISERKRHEGQVNTLIALAKAINAQPDIAAITSELASHLQPLLPFDWVGISLFAGDQVRLASGVGSLAADVFPTPLLRAEHPENVVWQVLEEGRMQVENTNKATEDVWGPLVRAYIHVPLVVEHRSLGLLHFTSKRPFVFTEEHATLASMVGEQVAVAVRHIDLLEQARSAEEKYRSLVNDVDAIVWELDPNDLSFTFVSPQAEAWFGVPLDQWLGEPEFWSSRVHPDDRARVVAERLEAAATSLPQQVEYRVVTADDRVLWLRELISPEQRDGRIRLRGIMVDLTESKRAEATIIETNAILKATQEAAADGMFLLENNGCVVSYNGRFLEMWKIEAEQLQNPQQRQQLLDHVLARLDSADEFREKIEFLCEHPFACSRDEVQLADGRVFERHSAPALASSGSSYGRVWSFSDVTEAKRYEQQLAHQAFHDPLTDLPNRSLFMDRLTREIARGGRTRKCTGVLFLDLDRFKVINDSMGHQEGDLLLVEVAHRLGHCLRPSDTAARFGGDEYSILIEDVTGVEEIIHVAERVAQSLKQPFNLNGTEVHMSASIGIVIGNSDGKDRPDDMMRNADVAMYRAKHRGGARFEVFDSEMNHAAMERLQLEIELRQAVKREQLQLQYQPLVDLETDQIIGVEALVRWEHPVRGVVPPSDFIPLAEEIGMIHDIGKWVLYEACTQGHRWHQELPNQRPLTISVNLSGKQFEQPDLVEDVRKVLEATSIDPSSLELEITETVVMENADNTISQLHRLKSLGVKLAVDDFGTGYSSLAYIERFPLDTLKIDRSFVSQIGTNGDGMAIMRAVNTLGQALGVRVTAEGIETNEQLTQLRSLGCNNGQGYLFARPVSHSAMRLLLQESRGGHQSISPPERPSAATPLVSPAPSDLPLSNSKSNGHRNGKRPPLVTSS